MTGPPAVDRETVVALLAAWRDRAPESVAERIGSLDLAWLVHAVEDKYQTDLDLDDAALERMETVSGAVEVLRAALSGGAP